MKRTYVIWITVLLILTDFLPTTNGGEPLGGTTLYVGGSGPGNHTRIQDAINAANAGDTIFIYHDSSPYNENIIINKTLALLGENQTTTHIDGRSKSHTITVNAPNTLISGLTITQPSDSWENSNVYLSSNNTTIIGNTLMHGNGIYCLNCSLIIIKNLTIFNASYGLYLWQTISSSFENNSISGCMQGVYGYSCQNCYFFNNTIYNSYDGFYMVWGDCNTYHHNKLYENANVGMSVDGDIQYNIISNSYYGAFVGEGIFAHNIIQYCNLGMESTGFITVIYNTIRDCTFLGLFVSNILTIVSYNNFINNSQDASSEQAVLTRWYGNYWGRPLLGPKIIIGSIGYGYISIPWINFDWHPAQEPYDILEST